MFFESEITLLKSCPNIIITQANSASSKRLSSQVVYFTKRVRKNLNNFLCIDFGKAIKLN